MAASKKDSANQKKSASVKSGTKNEILKESFVEQELLNASVVQRELMGSIKDLNSQLGVLNTTLNLIRQHEFVELHRSKWRIIAYQLALGILFAIGTVTGLALISWATYTFFKDNEILRQIVDKQLNSRSFNLNDIKDRAMKDASWSKSAPLAIPTASVMTASGSTGSSSGVITAGTGSVTGNAR